MLRRKYMGTMAGLVGTLCNVVLATIKVLLAISSNSAAILSDACNNLMDAAASIAITVGFWVSDRTPDAKHPFGYGRVEYLIGLIVACLIMGTGVGIGKFALERIWQAQSITISPFTFCAIAISILVKLGMGIFYLKMNKKLRSQAIQAGFIDSLSDAAMTIVTLCSLLLADLVPLPLDAIVGLIVAGIIILAGAKSAKDALRDILGKGEDQELVQCVHKLVLSIKGIQGIHGLIIHDYGPSRKYASAHIELEPSMKFVDIHSIIEKATTDAKQILALDLVLHPEPYETSSGPVIMTLAT